jgi:hypothetical protein
MKKLRLYKFSDGTYCARIINVDEVLTLHGTRGLLVRALAEFVRTGGVSR